MTLTLTMLTKYFLVIYNKYIYIFLVKFLLVKNIKL